LSGISLAGVALFAGKISRGAMGVSSRVTVHLTSGFGSSSLRAYAADAADGGNRKESRCTASLTSGSRTLTRVESFHLHSSRVL